MAPGPTAAPSPLSTEERHAGDIRPRSLEFKGVLAARGLLKVVLRQRRAERMVAEASPVEDVFCRCSHSQWSDTQPWREA